MLTNFILAGFAVLVGFGMGATVLQIGQHRKPITPGVAFGTVVIGMFELSALMYLASQLP